MKIDVVTIFPNIIDSYISESIIKKAINDDLIEINVINLRHYSDLKHNQVDNTVYGGGAGMLLMFPPFYRVLRERMEKKTKVILPSPKGKTLTQKMLKELVKEEHLIILCGHYEGIDERVNDFVDYEISIGDYILTGGELPALVLIDSLTRLKDGVISEESHLEESFEDDLLEYPQYTKPQQYEGYTVPDVLLSGHHQKISNWRKFMALKETYLKRPDLLESKELTKEEKEMLNIIKEELKKQAKS